MRICLTSTILRWEREAQNHLDIFVRGIFAEYLMFFIMRTGDKRVLEYTEKFLQVFLGELSLLVVYTDRIFLIFRNRRTGML